MLIDVGDALMTSYCSGDGIYNTTHQFCYGDYSTDHFTDHLSVGYRVNYIT